MRLWYKVKVKKKEEEEEEELFGVEDFMVEELV